MGAVSYSPDDALSSTEELLEMTMEQALRRANKPPREAAAENKVGMRRVLPELVETLGAYSARYHLSRATITFNLVDYGMLWVESLASPYHDLITDLRAECADTGNLDLLALLDKAEFACFSWKDYGPNGTTITVPDGIKGRAGRIADDFGIAANAVVQYALAWAWTRSDRQDSKGTVERTFVPQLLKFQELVTFGIHQAEGVTTLLEQRKQGVTIRSIVSGRSI